MRYDIKYVDPETDLQFEYRAEQGAVYISRNGDANDTADKLHVGFRRFLRSNIIRLVAQYKSVGGRKYEEWQKREEYIQLTLTG